MSCKLRKVVDSINKNETGDVQGQNWVTNNNLRAWQESNLRPNA